MRKSMGKRAVVQIAVQTPGFYEKPGVFFFKLYHYRKTSDAGGTRARTTRAALNGFKWMPGG